MTYLEKLDEALRFQNHYAELEKENKKLKSQIEKMKCCGNCAHQCSFLFQDELDCFNNNFSNWELGEIKENDSKTENA